MDLLLLSAGLAGLAVLAIMMAVGSFINADRRIGTRLETYVSVSDFNQDVPAHQTDDEMRDKLTGRLNRTLSNSGFASRIRRSLARADIPLTVLEYALIRLAAMLLPAAIALLLIHHLISALVAALLGWFLPLLWVRRRQKQRLRLFEEQLPEALTIMINSLRAGFSLNQALSNIAEQAPNPMAAEMRRVVQEIQLGIPISDALTNLAYRMESQDLELLVAVLKIHTRIGGNLIRVLESISTTIRERTRLRREIRVITAQQRFSSYILGLLPVILVLILLVINPDYILGLFEPGWTLCIPVGALVTNVLGFLIIRRIVDIQV